MVNKGRSWFEETPGRIYLSRGEEKGLKTWENPLRVAKVPPDEPATL